MVPTVGIGEEGVGFCLGRVKAAAASQSPALEKPTNPTRELGHLQKAAAAQQLSAGSLGAVRLLLSELSTEAVSAAEDLGRSARSKLFQTGGRN